MYRFVRLDSRAQGRIALCWKRNVSWPLPRPSVTDTHTSRSAVPEKRAPKPGGGVPRPVREEPVPDFPAVVHPIWRDELPWLVQGTTTRGPGLEGAPYDLRRFGADGAVSGGVGPWQELGGWAGAHTVVHARQVHGGVVCAYPREGAGDRSAGVERVADCDGHYTDRPGVLLAVTVADCVPVFVVDPERRAVALLHAGWRGAAAGILERGVLALGRPEAVGRFHVHLGPAICGRCYEVGGEVFEALGLPRPAGPTHLDLYEVLGERASRMGVPEEHVTRSTHCTRCGDGRFYSHRGGDAGRQAAFLGVRAIP